MSARAPSVDAIIRRVAYEMGVAPRDIVGPWRTAPIVRARFAVAWLARETTCKSFPQIGMAMGARDHSTIMGQRARAEQLRAADPAFRALTDGLKAEWTGGAAA